MDGNPFEETMTLRSDVGALLAEMPIFSGLDATLLREIASAVEWLSMPGGEKLFSAGDPPDALYMVLSGCLGAFSPDPTRRRFLARIAAGDMVGEMGLISGRPRSADVVALRDTELARISAKAFDEVLRGQPEAMLRIARLTVDRLAQSRSSAAAARGRGACTFTVLPQSVEVDFGGFASRLVKALAQLGRAELVWSVRARLTPASGSTRSRPPTTTWCMSPTRRRSAGPSSACARRTRCCSWRAPRVPRAAGPRCAGPTITAWRRSAPKSCCCTTAPSRRAPPHAGSPTCRTCRITTCSPPGTIHAWRAC